MEAIKPIHYGEVRIPKNLWHQLQEALLTERYLESKCFMLCHTLELPGRAVFLVREVVPLSESDYEVRSPSLVVTRAEFVHRLLMRCYEENLSLLEAHSHPWSGFARFSSIDHQSDYAKFQTTQSLSPSFRHGALVFGNDMSFEGHMWDWMTQRIVPIVRIAILSIPYCLQYDPAYVPQSLGEALQAVYDRQVRALGIEGQRILSQITVALVGAGGLGSQIGQALAHLGFGQILWIDPDRLELTNLNRVVGATYAQAKRGVRKVKALAQRLNRLFPADSSPLVPIPADVRSEQLLPLLLGCDLIIGAVDSAVVRQYLNLVAVCGLIPYIDAGVGIRAQNGVIQQAGGQVQIVVPGKTACLTCVGNLVQASVEEQLTPEQRELSVRAGYIQGERIPNPQVIFLNGVVANLLIWETIKLLTHCQPACPYVYYDLVAQTSFPVDVPREPDCYLCGDSNSSLLGTGVAGIRGFLAKRNARAIPVPQPPQPITESAEEVMPVEANPA